MKINRPDFSLEDIYETCISHYRDSSKTTLMKSIYNDLLEDEKRYKKRLEDITLFKEKAHVTHNKDISKEDLNKLYKDKLLNKDLEVRKYYDKLIAGSDLCPYCAKRSTETLDHFLSKSNYPNFSITPLNLVPCCSDCNRKKDNKDGELNEKVSLLFHPYQEPLSDFKWLDASIEKIDRNIFFKYYVISNGLDKDTVARLENYIKCLDLDEYYSKSANIKFNRFKDKYSQIYRNGGKNELNNFFVGQLNLHDGLEHGLNSYEYIYFDTCIKYIDTIIDVL